MEHLQRVVAALTAHQADNGNGPSLYVVDLQGVDHESDLSCSIGRPFLSCISSATWNLSNRVHDLDEAVRNLGIQSLKPHESRAENCSCFTEVL